MAVSTSMRTRGRAWTVALGLLLSLGGCVNTSLIDRWRDPSYNGPPLHKVLVVGVQRDDGRRRMWEDGMVAALSRQGLQATASYAVFPNKAPSADELAALSKRVDVLNTHIEKLGRRTGTSSRARAVNMHHKAAASVAS